MFLADLRANMGEAMLVINGALQPVEIQEIESGIDEYPRLSMIALNGTRGTRISARFRDQMRLTYGMVAKNPFLYDLRTPSIEKVVFNNPATVVIWSDNTKTVVKCQPGDEYSKEVGLAMCISKKFLGNEGNFNETFKKYLSEKEI